MLRLVEDGACKALLKFIRIPDPTSPVTSGVGILLLFRVTLFAFAVESFSHPTVLGK
jgi:hypothetical protein